MGFLIAFNRTMYLTQFKNQLESQITEITSQKLSVSDSIAQLTSQIGDLGNPDSPAVKALEARKAEIENLEKKLDAKLQKLQTQLQAVNTEMQSATQNLTQNIQTAFTYGLGGGGR